ncbi:MAG: orotidine-5'-phosphate decarboxylase [Nitrospirae bacterium]|nr:orotidine-5'-phosphate decarboxylase [Nitrospirota bacterium]
MKPKDRIILALDVDSVKAAEDAVRLLKDHVGAFKVGFELFTSAGPSIVEAVIGGGGKVFLDLKYHDIPNTVAKAVRAAVRMGVTFVDVHASGGHKMMAAASDAARDESEKLGMPLPVCLAVTVLTSMGERELREEVGVARTPLEQVLHLAVLAKSSGMGGVVASPREAAAIRNAVGKDMVIVTPGVRPAWASRDDQNRVATPGEAVKAGSDYLVIGRPILASNDPVEAAGRIAEELHGL